MQSSDTESGELAAHVVELAIELRHRPAEPIGSLRRRRQEGRAAPLRAQSRLGEDEHEEQLVAGERESPSCRLRRLDTLDRIEDNVENR